MRKRSKGSDRAGDRLAVRAVHLTPILLLLITVALYWKLLLTNQYTWIDTPDICNQVLPWFQFQAVEWQHHRFPLWDPNLWAGQPLIGQAQPGAVYPLNWLLFLAPRQKGFVQRAALHWYFVLIHYLGALFCYWLCRDLGRSRAASLFGGIVFGLGGYIGTTDWPQMLNGAIWAPLVFLFLLRMMRGAAPVVNAAVSGAFLGVSFLSGHHQIPIFVSLAAAGVWIYYLITAPSRSRFGNALVFAGFALLVSAFQTLPAYEYGKLAVRWVGGPEPVRWGQPVPYFVHEEYSLGPISLLGIVIPGIHRNADPFIGIVALSLAVLGLASHWREKMTRLFAAVAIGGLWIALGRNSVFHGVLYALVPMVEKARAPAMAILIFHFGAAVLSAYGIDTCHVSWPRRLQRTAAIVAAFAVLILGTLVTLVISKGTAAVTDDRSAITGLVSLLLAAALYSLSRLRISESAAVACLILLLVLELGNVTGYMLQYRNHPDSYYKKLAGNEDIANFLRAQKARFEVDENAVPGNWGDWYGIDMFGGYVASLPVSVYRLQGDAAARKLFAVDYFAGSKPAREGQTEVFQGASGLKVYRNPPGALPRVWTVHEAAGISKEDEILSRIHDPQFDPRRRALLPGGAPKLEWCGDQDKVELVRRESNRVTIRAEMQCRGMVILADTFFPGWQASVDGRPSEIYAAYTALRGIVVNSGPHTIEMRYRPGLVYCGGALTALGLLGVCALVWLSARIGADEGARPA